MQRNGTQSRPDWRAILTFYFLACAFQWPFFWWRDVNTTSWNASRIPIEIRDLTWGPAVAAFLVLYLFPHTRTRTISLFGTSRARSLYSFLIPILFSWIGVAIQTGRISYKLIYYLFIGGVSMFGEEMGWRGFLQGSLRPMGTVRGYLLLAFMWEAWHFTSHTKGTPYQVIERLAIYVPLVILITFFLGFVTERTGSVLLATTFHEWMDIFTDPAGNGGFFWSGLACIPVWMWLIWSWPKRKPDAAEDPTTPQTTAATAQ